MNGYQTGNTAQLRVEHALAELYWQPQMLLYKAITGYGMRGSEI